MGKVLSVRDGDSFTILYAGKTFKCRLSNVDAPELEMPFGEASRDHLSSLILNQNISFNFYQVDPYGRWVVDAYLEGLALDSISIAHGWSWHYSRYSRKGYLETLEYNAKKAGLGLWRCPEPLSPWEYRSLCRRVKIVFESLDCN